MVIVTAYTPGNEYENAAMTLLDSCRKLGVEATAYQIPPCGDDPQTRWKLAEHYKPRAVIAGLLEFAPQPVLWLDADCVLFKAPTDPIDGPDIAFTSKRRWRRGDIVPIQPEPTVFDFTQRQSVPNEQGEHTPWGGWIWFNNTQAVRKMIVRAWIPLADAYANECSDEQTLMEALRRNPQIVQGELLNDFAHHIPIGNRNGKPGSGWL